MTHELVGHLVDYGIGGAAMWVLRLAGRWLRKHWPIHIDIKITTDKRPS